MSKLIPYLSEEAIENDARALLVEFANARGLTIEPPIPIEDIIEKHHKLRIEFDDTHKLFGVPRQGIDPDILGAIFFDDRRIVIDESLDPVVNPAKEGCYHWTAAHEGCGHWRLHRYLFATASVPSFICRSSEAKKREEWQADFYSSCVLMPRKLVFPAWEAMYPDRKPRVLKPWTPVSHPYVEIPRFGDHGSEGDDQALNQIARPLAKVFRVSTTAMRIRLEKLGLLLRVVPHQQIRAGVS